MSKGFKICLIVIGAYCVLMSPLIWEGVKAGNYAAAGGPVYIGLLFALLSRQKKRV